MNHAKNLIVGIVGSLIAAGVIWVCSTYCFQPGITSPSSGQRVAHETAVTGNYGEKQKNADIWIVTQPVKSPHFHPQPGPVPKETSGKWHGIAYVGEATNHNVGFELVIYMIAADPAASNIFSNYVKTSEANKEWLGLTTLPISAVVVDSVKVIRN